MRQFSVYILHCSHSEISFGWSATHSTIEQPAAAASCTSHQTAHLAGATLDDQKAIFAHCACLLGVCQGCTSVSALEMHIVSVVMIVCHVYMHSCFLSGLPTVPSAVHNDCSSSRRLLCSSSLWSTHTAVLPLGRQTGRDILPKARHMQSGCTLPPAQQSSFGSNWQH